MKGFGVSPEISEIRAILMGWVRYEGPFCVAATNIGAITFSGLNNGATSARIWGVKKKHGTFKAPPDRNFKIDEVYDEISAKTEQVRRFRYQLVYLVSDPDALVFFIRPIISNPVIVKIISNKNILEVTIYTARNLTAGIHLRRMMNYMGRVLPSNCSLVKKERKKEKKHEKK